jgi:hypothetical protein
MTGMVTLFFTVAAASSVVMKVISGSPLGFPSSAFAMLVGT